jgi:hypothetical protein
MLTSISKPIPAAGHAGGNDDAEYTADLSRHMVEDLQAFLAAALANEPSSESPERGQYRWPLRYNSGGGVESQLRVGEE